MEMSGNVYEAIVNTTHHGGWSFTGLHGNGELLSTGDADVDYWPGINGNTDQHTSNTAYSTSGVTGYSGAGARGTDHNFSTTGLPISSRMISASLTYSQRKAYSGGRGCRIAP